MEQNFYKGSENQGRFIAVSAENSPKFVSLIISFMLSRKHIFFVPQSLDRDTIFNTLKEYKVKYHLHGRFL